MSDCPCVGRCASCVVAMVTLSSAEMKCSGLGQVADFFLDIGWENTLTGYVGGNLCFVAGEVFNLEKGKEKGGCGGWRRRGSCHLLPCWSTVMLLAFCKPWISRSLPFMRAGTSHRVSWHCPLISVATMGLCALFFVCSTTVYS